MKSFKTFGEVIDKIKELNEYKIDLRNTLFALRGPEWETGLAKDLRPSVRLISTALEKCENDINDIQDTAIPESRSTVRYNGCVYPMGVTMDGTSVVVHVNKSTQCISDDLVKFIRIVKDLGEDR